jgi:nanoRNase/pAp phosphatase (c-di-AMP/oligoRNAs hydrolase)
MWKEVSSFIRAHQSFIVTTHIHPEGDAIGSEVAMAAFLKDLGKRAIIVNSSPTPSDCLFLPLAEEIKVYPSEYQPEMIADADAVIIVDVNNWHHLGPFGDEMRRSPKPRVCIDHHQGRDEEFADIIVTDTEAAAAGLMVYDLIKYMAGTITQPIANAIYAAILTDTGSFRFSNTDERAFRAAADLCTLGVVPFDIYKKAFAKSWGAARLVGPALSTLESTADGRIAWIQVTRRMLEESGAEYEDSDSLLELVRPVRGVELCIAFKEVAGGKVKVSLRSNGGIDAFAIAKRHGGGGHRMAAGMTTDGPMTEAIAVLVAECERAPVTK